MDRSVNVVDPALRGVTSLSHETANNSQSASAASHARWSRGDGAGRASSADAHHEENSPGTPHSDHDDSNDGTPHHDSAHDPNHDPKRPRACEACRGLKVRCEPDPNDTEGPCKRCKKAGRSCVVTVPTRKRQKKTDSRVAELEKKIDALTASLQARGSVAPPMVSAPARPEPVTVLKWGNHGMTGHFDEADANSRVPSILSRESYAPDTPRFQPPPPAMAGQKRKFTDRNDTPSEAESRAVAPPNTASNDPDVIERGILSMSKAVELFARYNNRMVQHLPAVVFPPETTLAELRRTKPILLLAVLAGSSSETPSLQRQLVRDLMQILADKVIVTGEKSIELIQALHIAVMWYWPPEHYEELKFYQLVHIAAVMAIDLGLGRRSATKRAQVPYNWKHHPTRKSPPPDPTTIESRRTWLACYFLAANTSMALHRPCLVRWTVFMQESLEMLESSPDAAPTDKYFCHLVRTHQLAEEVGIQFSMDDPSSFVKLDDSRNQYAMRALERSLEACKARVSKELLQPTLKISLHVVSLYMHEIALSDPYPGKDADSSSVFDPSTAKDDAPSEPSAIIPAHVNALSACLTAIHGIFETFLAMNLEDIRCLPTFNFVRVAYGVVVLIKMYFSATAPNSELGKVMGQEHLKVDYYLERLLAKFRNTAANDQSRPAAKFLVVVVMLRSWFLKQGKGWNGSNPNGPPQEGGCPFELLGRPTTGPETASSCPEDGKRYATPQMQQEYPQANTPLQLLSEIATNDRSHARSAPIMWLGSRQAAQPFMYDAEPAVSSSTPSTVNIASNTEVSTPSVMNGLDPTMPVPNTATPWVDTAFADFNDLGLNSGFAGGMSLEELAFGFGDSPSNMENGMRHALANDAWFGEFFQSFPGAGTMLPM